jgi:hypothetical protein
VFNEVEETDLAAEQMREHQFGCTDQSNQCEGWHGIGECESNRQWMSEHCPMSCNPECAEAKRELMRTNKEVQAALAAENARLRRKETDAARIQASAQAAAERAAAVGANSEVAARFNQNILADQHKHRLHADVRGPRAAHKEVQVLDGGTQTDGAAAAAAAAASSDRTFNAAVHAVFGDASATNPSIAAMARRNVEQTLYNIDRFPLDWTSPSLVVIVIMSHNRPLNLAAAFASLRKTRGVEKALVIISQDYQSAELDAVLDAVDFCVLLRIFLPASTQLHSTEFPGTDSRDCTVKTPDGKWYPPSKAKAVGCQNAAYPDMYGHYREAGYGARFQTDFCTRRCHWILCIFA